MKPPSAPTAPTIVVFDLGGVMAKICHTWQDACTSAGVKSNRLPPGATPLAELKTFDLYQAGKITLQAYLEDLAQFIGCKTEDSLAVHNGILVAPYPGIDELVREVQDLGLGTGCLSNTNEPHWEVLTLNGRYPAVQALDMKMASHLVGISKPSQAIYKTYCSTFEIEPSSIIFFDDYRVNVEGAQACGWNARWIDSSGDTPAQMRAHLHDLGVL